MSKTKPKLTPLKKCPNCKKKRFAKHSCSEGVEAWTAWICLSCRYKEEVTGSRHRWYLC